MPTKKKSNNIMHLSIMRNFAIKKKKIVLSHQLTK